MFEVLSEVQLLLLSQSFTMPASGMDCELFKGNCYRSVSLMECQKKVPNGACLINVLIFSPFWFPSLYLALRSNITKMCSMNPLDRVPLIIPCLSTSFISDLIWQVGDTSYKDIYLLFKATEHHFHLRYWHQTLEKPPGKIPPLHSFSLLPLIGFLHSSPRHVRHAPSWAL